MRLRKKEVDGLRTNERGEGIKNTEQRIYEVT
jgi:hypothetical protein